MSYQFFINVSPLYKLSFLWALKLFNLIMNVNILVKEYRQFCDSKGIIHETTCPHTPQQNGIIKQKNRHILETVRTIMGVAHMP
jgi:hypothetical protein